MKFRVSGLIEKIEENKEKHIENYNQALEGYKKVTQKKLRKYANDLKNGKKIPTTIHLTRPKSYEEDYTKILTMLRMTTEEELELSDYEFSCYVMDKWDWKVEFLSLSSQYTEV